MTKEPEKWDKETDIVVIGYGYAGTVSACEASDNGSEVIILEKMTHPGGRSAFSGNISDQKGRLSGGFADNTKRIFDRLEQLNMGMTPADVHQAIAEDMPKNRDWAIEFRKKCPGIEFETPENPRFTIRGFTGLPFYSPKIPNIGVWNMKVCMANVESRNIEVMFSTSAKELISDATGAVIGVKAETAAGKPVNIKARKAVILATGGFESNPELVKQYVEGGMFYHDMGNKSNTGDGIIMAQKMGADLWHMWHVHGGYGFWRPELARALRAIKALEKRTCWIVVDKLGRRYMDEYAHSEQDITHRPMQHFDSNLAGPFLDKGTGYPRLPSWCIFDEEGRELGPLFNKTFGYPEDWNGNVYQWSDDNSVEITKGWVVKADTIEELAKKIKEDPDNEGLMDPDKLSKTVSRWNEYAPQGKDPDFHRIPRGKEAKLGILPSIKASPFYAVKVWPVIVNTQGGPRHDAKCQIVDTFGKPIPRLYECGELGSIFGYKYWQGANIEIDCFAKGRIAGRNAASEKPWG